MTSGQRTRIGWALLVVTLPFSVLANDASAQCRATAYEKVLADDGDVGDKFGVSVSISGDLVIVGAHWDDNENGVDAGAAYVFRVDGPTWRLEAKLLADDGEEGNWFGWSVSLDGNLVLIGARNDNGGSAYLFRFDGSQWSQEAKLVPSVGGRFGTSVVLDGDLAIVGAYRHVNENGQIGAAYVFRYDGSDWLEEAKLLAADGGSRGWFGYRVAIDGDVAIVGDIGHEDFGGFSGAAYIFRFDPDGEGGWNQEAKLLAKDGYSSHEFGFSVGIQGDVALIGAVHDNDNGVLAGAVYFFRFDGENWTQEAKLLTDDGPNRGRFGHSLAFRGDVALIGAINNVNEDGIDAGSAYIFRFDGSRWTQHAKLRSSDGADGDRFGGAVAFDGDMTIVGAINHDDEGANSGSAYLFRGLTTDCNENATVDLCDIADGTSEDENGNGIPDECECLRDPAWQCDGDVDGDGQVNPVDSGLVQASFGSTDEADLCQYDIDCDGQINPLDSGIVQSLFGTCEAPREVCP